MPETGSVECDGASSWPQSAPTTPTQKSSHGSLKKADDVAQHAFANPTLSIINGISRRTSTSGISSPSREGTPPPLPPRPQLGFLSSRPPTSHSLRKAPSRPQLVSKATTQLSLSNGQAFGTESRDDAPASDAAKQRSFLGVSRPSRASEADDNASVVSYMTRAEGVGEGESILGEMTGREEKTETEKTLLKSLGPNFIDSGAQSLFPPDAQFDAAFNREFDEMEDINGDGSNEEAVMRQWRAKLKHFLILSSAGKPIYSRHGHDQLIGNYIGVVQTIISFYQSAKDTLRGFTAGDVRFVVMSQGPLNLVAITRLPESDSQLRSQLEALYMQILSTLTLPNMERMFAARANYDLRRPLQGTETLLSALADGFTRGSLSTLLSALECLKLRKSHRATINNTLLKTRSENLLYGLIVASGKLVSVVRPKKHSLHPGDLHLVFNMLFEAGSVKAGGGENWIPLCLPGFNNTGYLYMYVSFLNLEHPTQQMQERSSTSEGAPDEVAILLISANKESFFELRTMRDDLVETLQHNGSIDALLTAVKLGRLKCTDIVPGSPLRHFLYKSRSHVQFTMPSFDPYFQTTLDKRRLLNLYIKLHANMHSKPNSLKVHYETNTTSMALAWSSPLFELYAVAPASTSRAALAQSANQIVQWVEREEERVFIIGGAVF
ncbi:trafficking protein Mon1-domain-containing protein [Ampelomyces quisqualis]|uniref:Vacuolar fusion protein MON1 n=1 Tax=Ampelomyces quisqualis TaxID=50730 RepID=A0A6A5R2T6_AMPQU|nr:trafficking protein Mon1-domain-containing protein [Ampelomyces quisqualis]